MSRKDPKFDVCFVFFTELRTDARTLNLARTLVGNGYRVCAIAGGTAEDVSDFSREGITLFPVSIKPSVPFRKKLIDYILNSRRYFTKATAKIYAGMDLYSFYVARKLAKRNNARLFYDSREIYSALGPLAKQKSKQSVLAYFEKVFIKDADAIIVSGELDAEYLKSYFAHQVPYFVIMNLPPYKTVNNTGFLREQFGIGRDKIILLYQGMLLPGRGIIAAIKSLIFDERFVLVIYGAGFYKETLIEEVNKLGLKERVFLNSSVSYDRLHEITCSADIGLTIIEPISLSYKLALPNKLFEYCMAGIPSLLSDLPAMKKINEKYEIGELIGAKVHAPEIAVKLDYIYRNIKKYQANCLSASKELNYEAQTKTILDLFKMENES